MTHILSMLNRTPPPVLIFAEKKQDVDLIQEYLLLKGVSAAAIHGGKDQEDRTAAIDAFKVPLSRGGWGGEGGAIVAFKLPLLGKWSVGRKAIDAFKVPLSGRWGVGGRDH